MDQELAAMINTLVTTHLPKVLDRIEALESKVADLDGKLAALLKITEQPSRNTPKSKRKSQSVAEEEQASQQEVQPVQQAQEEQSVRCAAMPDVQSAVQAADDLIASITPQHAAAYLNLVQNGYTADDIPAMARYMQVDEAIAHFLAERPIAWVSSYAAQATA